MEANTYEEQLDGPGNTKPDSPSGHIIPTQDTENINPTQETNNMEVHHHPDLHHKPKKWKEYFLEFLMIFLAVTMGFFSENIREHFGNKEKEKKYMLSMLLDLKKDTAEVTRIITLQKSLVSNT